jgi:hypothetical protein
MSDDQHSIQGLTIRELYAGLALQGLLSNAQLTIAMETSPALVSKKAHDVYSKAAVKYADALIAKLKRTTKND